MALSDLFTLPFLFSLGLTLLITGLLGMFFMQRLQEQNHKMSSMLGLVSTMAEEMNIIRGRLQMGSSMQQMGSSMQQMAGETRTFEISPHLIPVSDGEGEDDGDEEDEDEEDEDDDEDDEDDDDDEDNDVKNEIIDISSPSIKVINFGAQEEEFIPLDQDESEEQEEDQNEEDEDDDEMEELEELEEEEEEEKEKEEVVKPLEKKETIDYKKLSLPNLKSIAIEKKLITETTKATKASILKMLGAE